jgi:hypothetical protein
VHENGRGWLVGCHVELLLLLLLAGKKDLSPSMRLHGIIELPRDMDMFEINKREKVKVDDNY